MKSHRLYFFLLTSLALLAMGYQWAQARLAAPQVRAFVEAKAREILKAEVKIGKIRYLPPARIVLKEIQIERSPLNPSFSIVEIKKLILGYNLINFIRGDFRIPGSVVMDSPRIQFAPRPARAHFLDSAFSFSRAVPAVLKIQGGEFHVPWAGSQNEWVLRKVHFKARPDLRGRISLELASELSGVAQGAVVVQGFSDALFKHYELEVRMKGVTFSPESRIPLKKIQGKFHLSEKGVEIHGLTSFFHDWLVEWKGRIEDWQAKPNVTLELSHLKGKSPFRLTTALNFQTEKLRGEWTWAGRPYPFKGRVFQEGKKILLPNLELPHGYSGNGLIDRSNGDYRLGFHRDQRRFQIHSNLNQLEFHTDFQLDHASINHLDWVVSGKARFLPVPKKADEEALRFKGWVQTDYFIIEYEPMEEFQGTFELDREGIEAIDFKWGGVFRLGGRLLFKGGVPREDFVLRVDGFPLESSKDFGRRPLPHNLSGTLEGKLKLRGEVARPEIQGYFTIKDGTLEKLDFDRAVIQFQGFPPYLKLYDSKIFRGRSTLKMLGAINLGLENIFHGIQIKGPDSLVIWRGVSAWWKEGRSAIQAEKPLTKKLTMGIEVGAGSPDTQGEDREETHAVLGPKVRF